MRNTPQHITLFTTLYKHLTRCISATQEFATLGDMQHDHEGDHEDDLQDLGGTCIFFHKKKGWGFIRPDDIKQEDIFVHKDDIMVQDMYTGYDDDVQLRMAQLEPFQACTYRTGKDHDDRKKAVNCNPGRKILDRIKSIEKTLSHDGHF
jgi:hypothetical protein